MFQPPLYRFCSPRNPSKKGMTDVRAEVRVEVEVEAGSEESKIEIGE
jgi:hypothetical protein